MLDLLHFIHLTQILIELLLIVDGPVLKRELSLKPTNWLVKRTHQGLNQEAARATKGVPKIQFPCLACAL